MARWFNPIIALNFLDHVDYKTRVRRAGWREDHPPQMLLKQSYFYSNFYLSFQGFWGFGEEPSRLLIVIHHLAVDGVSWRILLDDLQQLLAGQSLSSKTHSYRDWGNALVSYASSANLLKELAYWKEVATSVVPLPTDFDKGPATGSYIDTVFVSLSESETQALLKEVHHSYRTEINDILLTALLLSVGDWTKSYNFSFFLEGHGREEIIAGLDLSRTIGWFTSIFPVTLKIEDPTNLAEVIKSTKEHLRHIPNKGIGYGILKYLDPENSLSCDLSPGLSFNYLGQWDNTTEESSSLTFASESSGVSTSLLNKTDILLNLNGEVRDSVFTMAWSYSQNHYHRETIQTLSKSFITRLREVINFCTQSDVFGYTPSDFDFVKLEQVDIVHQII